MARGGPKDFCSGTWTAAKFKGFIRNTLRRASMRWKPRNDAKIAARRPNESDNKRLKWEYQCCQCKNWFPDKEVEVDHIVPCGAIDGEGGLDGFVARLFCEVDGFQILCKHNCHHGKTNTKK